MTTIAHMNVVLADGVSSATVAWFTLAGAIGGVLVTGLVSLVTATLTHRWQSQSNERQRIQDLYTLVRQERRESYAAYWLAWNRFTHELRRLAGQIRDLPPGVIVNRYLTAVSLETADPDELKKQLQDLSDKAWEAELEWRAAADALLLVADPEVEKAAHAHIAMTEQKIAAAFEGKSHHDENGAAYRSLNNAMRAALLRRSNPADDWVGELNLFGVRIHGPEQL